jgi:signal transduction histidine kinase
MRFQLERCLRTIGNREMLRRSTRLTLATAVLSAAATALVTALPALDFAYRQRELHVGLETASALIALLASYLLLGRFLRRRRLDDLALFVAMSLFALSNLFFAALPAMLLDGGSERFSTWAALSGRLLGAVALALGAFAPPRTVRAARREAVFAMLIPVGIVGTTALVVGAFHSSFPSGVEAELTPEASGRPRLVAHPAIFVVQLVAGALFAAAAVGFVRRSSRERDGFVRWLGVASVLGAFARINYFLYPSLYTEWVYVGDAFRLLFYAVVLAAALREISSYWQAESRATILEDRRRLAGDLHGGVAQELALVGMNLKRLDQANEYVSRAVAGVERGLADARTAIVALRSPVDEPLDVALARVAREVAAREGTEVVLALSPGVEAPQETREALARILAEAITNAAQRGEADVVRVELEKDGRLSLRVQQSGTALQPALHALREQASALGGEVEVRSLAGGETEVEINL